MPKNGSTQSHHKPFGVKRSPSVKGAPASGYQIDSGEEGNHKARLTPEAFLIT
jgi:hypothetical protein